MREIGRAFGVSPGNRPGLRDMLRDIERSGAVTRAANRRFAPAARLPEVTVIERFGSDEDGVALARPVAWSGPDPAPTLRLVETGSSESLTIGERAAAREIHHVLRFVGRSLRYWPNPVQPTAAPITSIHSG